MRLTDLLRRMQTARERLKIEQEKPISWSKERTVMGIENTISSYNRQLSTFGGGLPIFQIEYQSEGYDFKVFYQAETKDEARAAFILHYQIEPDVIAQIDLRKPEPV